MQVIVDTNIIIVTKTKKVITSLQLRTTNFHNVFFDDWTLNGILYDLTKVPYYYGIEILVVRPNLDLLGISKEILVN